MIGVLGLVTITGVPAFAVSGILSLGHFKFTLFVFPVFLFAQFLGKKTFKKIDDNIFKKSLMFLLTVSGLIMIF